MQRILIYICHHTAFLRQNKMFHFLEMTLTCFALKERVKSHLSFLVTFSALSLSGNVFIEVRDLETDMKMVAGTHEISKIKQ